MSAPHARGRTRYRLSAVQRHRPRGRGRRDLTSRPSRRRPWLASRRGATSRPFGPRGGPLDARGRASAASRPAGRPGGRTFAVVALGAGPAVSTEQGPERLSEDVHDLLACARTEGGGWVEGLVARPGRDGRVGLWPTQRAVAPPAAPALPSTAEGCAVYLGTRSGVAVVGCDASYRHGSCSRQRSR